MASSGPKSPSTIVNDSSAGTGAWTNPGNAGASDDSYAEIDIPENSFTGIVDYSAKIVKSDGNIGSSNKAGEITLNLSDTYRVYGSSSDLWGETWSASDINNSNFGFVFQVLFNHWDDASVQLYSEYLKATNFGFSIPTGATIDGIKVEVEQQGERYDVSGGPPSPEEYNLRARVDHIRITVYYTEPTTTTTGVQSMTGVNTITFGVEGGGLANPV
jgi:hypothetical protein